MKKSIFFLVFTLASVFFSHAQLVMPSTLNVSGSSVNKGYYSFDWSIGESAAISTLVTSNLMITQGVLQYNAGNVVEKNIAMVWFPNEVRIFPNPVKNILEVDFKHLAPGTIHLQLSNISGQLLLQKDFIYNGVSHIEKMNLSGLPAGQYTLYIFQDQVPGSNTTKNYYKRGAFKIQKLK